MSDDLDIPESNREIALHLQSIRINLTHMATRLDTMEETIEERRYKRQDILMSSLLSPLVCGILLFLLTKSLG